jgi:HEAT repeat protein
MRPAALAVPICLGCLLCSAGCRKVPAPVNSGDGGASSTTNVSAGNDLAQLSADLKSPTSSRRNAAIERSAALDAQGVDVVPTLLEVLKDPTAGELGGTRATIATSSREAAVLAILNLKARGTQALQDKGLKTLEDGLSDPKPNVREHTANAIGMVGPDAARSAPALTQLCADNDSQVRSAAYSALERIRTVPTEPVVKLLRHPDINIAADAASALTWLKPTGPASVTLLLDALKRESTDKDDPAAVSYVRNAAAEALAGAGKGSEAAVPALVDLILKARVEDVERMSRPGRVTGTGEGVSGPVLALRRIGAPAVPSLVPLLKNEQSIVRYQAAAILGGMGPAGAPALPDVLAALEAERGLPTGQMYVFEELATAALNLGGDQEKITTPVIALLSHEEEGVRYGAVRLISRIGRRAAAAVPKLIELLNDPVVPVQIAAAEALGSIGPAAKGATGALAKKVEADDVDLARAATRSLRAFGPAAAPAVPALARVLDSSDQNFCIEAAQALAAIGPDAAVAVPALVKQLTDARTPRVEKEVMLAAIAAIGPAAKDALPTVTRLLADKEPALRVAAAAALGKIGSASPESAKRLASALNDSRLAVHVAALKALAEMGPAAAAVADDVKTYLASSREPAANIWAGAALLSFGVDAEANVKFILAAVKDKSPAARFARVAAVDAIGFLGAKAQVAVPDLREALRDKSVVSRNDRSTVRERAARSLGRLGGEISRPTIPALTELLRDPDPNARRAAIEALGMMGPIALVAVPKLRELSRTDPVLADLAFDALERIEPAPPKE